MSTIRLQAVACVVAVPNMAVERDAPQAELELRPLSPRPLPSMLGNHNGGNIILSRL